MNKQDTPGLNRWSQLQGWAISDPWRGLALLAAMASIVLLIPAELFYRHLGTTPTAAGITGIDVLLQQSALVLVMFAVLGALFSILIFAMFYPLVMTVTAIGQSEGAGVGLGAIAIAPMLIAFIGLLATAFVSPDDEVTVDIVVVSLLLIGMLTPWIVLRRTGAARRAGHRAALSLRGTMAVGGLWFGGAMLVFLSIAAAIPSADRVKDGEAPNSLLLPWQARNVTARWNVRDAPFHLPACPQLIYLGEDGNRVLLYDSEADRALRITSKSLELSFPDNC